MTNPFDNNEEPFKVLENKRGEYSLWPQHVEVPAGWDVRLEAPKTECVEYIDGKWMSLGQPQRKAAE
ncbi:MbtH family NRPS accessory protein (plasmid) [Agrobacterium sp. rho-8.1]